MRETGSCWDDTEQEDPERFDLVAQVEGSTFTWTTWDAGQMRAAVEYLELALPSGAQSGEQWVRERFSREEPRHDRVGHPGESVRWIATTRRSHCASGTEDACD